MSRGFYNYDTRPAPAYAQIETLERLLEDANNRIEQLEWDNKGIEEWRGVALDFMEAARIQRERAEDAEAERDALRAALRSIYSEVNRDGHVMKGPVMRIVDEALREGKMRSSGIKPTKLIEQQQSVPMSKQEESMKQSVAWILAELFPECGGVVLNDGTVLVSQQDIDKARGGGK